MSIATDPIDAGNAVITTSAGPVVLISRQSAAIHLAGASGQPLPKSAPDAVAWSPCGRWIAAIFDDKALHVWAVVRDGNNTPTAFSHSRTRRAQKRPIAVAFAAGADVVIADKFGDVVKFEDSEDESKSGPQVIAGHISMLLDVAVSGDQRYVLSADRDEKIRVSRYPNAYNIEAYCLGHTDFVSSIALFPQHPTLLASTSADGTLRLWEYASGRLLQTLELASILNTDEATAKPLGRKVAVCPATSHVAVVVDGNTTVALLKLEGEQLVLAQAVHVAAPPVAAAFDQSGRLWVVGQADHMSVQVFGVHDGVFVAVSDASTAAVLRAFEEQAVASSLKTSALNLQQLLKHPYDKPFAMARQEGGQDDGDGQDSEDSDDADTGFASKRRN